MKKLKKLDYRHYICIGITIAFLLISVFVFPHAFGRVIEGLRDFFVSLGYYFCELFRIPYNFNVTVNEFPKYPFFSFLENYKSPTTTLPETLEEYSGFWSSYWHKFASSDNFLSYFVWIMNLLYYVCNVILIFVPFFVITIFLIHRYLTTQNNDFGKESKPLIWFKVFIKKFCLPVKLWIKNFIDFIRDHKAYWIIWLCLWLYNFNAFTIALEFLAFYFYFVFSYDFANLYRQFYKLALDLWAVISFFPLWLWIVFGIIILSLISRKIAYHRLCHRERRNRGFINERGVSTIIYGNMGTGKTMLLTDMALSAEVELRDMAFEVILECDMKFPEFPWSTFENVLRHAIDNHVIYDVWSARRFIRSKRIEFEKLQCPDNLFGYDFNLYGMTYDDKLKVIDIWEVLEDYTCAYLVYTVQSSLIISNYSIRVDNLMSDLGNFPLWNSDFFKRDSRLLDSFSRHSHILDFDMLRLGKKMLENNPNRNAYGFGVYIVTEIDKERKNSPELTDVSKKDDNCNQKNDLFNVMLKMSRHAAVISNRVFVKVIGDLQRPESLGADARELGEVVFIDGQSDMQPILPFFSPFWVFDLFFSLIKGSFERFYTQVRYVRADNTLFMYLLKRCYSAMQHFDERTCNLYGSAQINLKVESGRMNGDSLDRKYFRQSKKIWAKRYSTDCLSGIFEVRGELNTIGIDDLKEYADIMAVNDELLYQNSHFQNEIQLINKSN